MRFFKKRRKYNLEIDPEDILLDAHNIPSFDKQQFEGKLERPISKRSVYFISIFFLLAGFVFISKLYSLQIERGTVYAQKSDDNSYKEIFIFSDRGLILDRNGKEIAWNETQEGEKYPLRKYIAEPGFGHVLGYVSYPKKDAYGFYWQDEYIGEYGVEKLYNEELKGQNGAYLYELDAIKDTDENTEPEVTKTIDPIAGEDVTLSIDADIQAKMYAAIKSLAERAGYTGGAGAIMDVHTGEMIAMTSYPEFDPEVMSKRDDVAQIRSYQKDKSKPFINRVFGGLYTPGSPVKPFIAIGALNEDVITPEKQIYSAGQIELVSPYDKTQVYVYKDNKAHGWVDMRHALAVSSNVYFYEIGGGFEDQPGLGISKINYYTKLFGLDEKTGIELPGELAGVIPSPEWKAENFNGDIWRVGDTYHTAIGQYGFQVTPLALLRGITTIANNGIMLRPTIIKGATPDVVKNIEISDDYYQVVKDGMHLVTQEGTAQLLSYLDFDLAAKTGTAQVGIAKKEVNSWITGFFPYDNPKYSFIFLMEKGPKDTSSATNAAYELLGYISKEKPEYLGLPKNTTEEE
ncbi:hypothetical protein KC852_01705 [Candidatus Nomurabacteria bacterium]|nr:hypothetical protein [Candidatus Nomurabacteria bacterium]